MVEISWLKFGPTRTIQISSRESDRCRTYEEAAVSLPKPGAGSRELFLVGGMIEVELAQTLLRQAREMEFSRDADSVDGRPGFERVIVDAGEFLPWGASGEGRDEEGLLAGASVLGGLFEGPGPGPGGSASEKSESEKRLSEVVDQRLLPYVRWRYGCASAVLSHALLRRYLPEERRIHPTHFDVQAFCTVVIGLNPDDFEGGLYVQPTPSSKSQAFVHLLTGDAVVHRYDVQHGVRVFSGERYSLIFWFKDSAEACASDTAPWYELDARLGDADAQLNLAGLLEQGLAGYSKDLVKAEAWYRRAAEAGQAQAQVALARFYFHGLGGLGKDTTLAQSWLQHAAVLGDPAAQRKVGQLLLEGAGEVNYPGSHLEGERWLREAAEQKDRAACLRLARYLLKADGSHAHQEALEWLTRAADLGDGSAQFELGLRELLGDNPATTDPVLAFRWISRSANNSFAPAQSALAVLLLESLQLWTSSGRCALAEEDSEPVVWSKAIRWLQDAADQGDPDGLYNIGLLFASGVGVTQDGNKAAVLFRAAVAAGSKDATELLCLARQTPPSDGMVLPSILEQLAASAKLALGTVRPFLVGRSTSDESAMAAAVGTGSNAENSTVRIPNHEQMNQKGKLGIRCPS
ncbi:unnamed protein product [Polarella glacialis]|uniref:Fe2OG dioxygenase domain-containing protein n=1 Tax=Polarella glacialis TaxID=89957 RepID=A0A813KQE8_POLGL|nr:unnamed protein product [Polarella glacialis]